jgi:hypothetical protein
VDDANRRRVITGIPGRAPVTLGIYSDAGEVLVAFECLTPAAALAIVGQLILVGEDPTDAEPLGPPRK